jgi:hypothetical protein
MTTSIRLRVVEIIPSFNQRMMITFDILNS